jgi:hypothetical protein
MKSTFSVQYSFSQYFNFPQSQAYRWCTDYQPGDIELMGSKGVRRIQRINDETLVLTDVYSGKNRVTKRRLVRLFPKRFSWTNTRLSASGRYSQFLYEILPDGQGSKLVFTGSQIFDNMEKPSDKKIASLSKELSREDGAAWKRLAEAMQNDLGIAKA